MPISARLRPSVALAFAALVATLALAASPAGAADTALLIQLQQDGSYRVWHSQGVTNLPEQELLELEAGARPEGSEIVQTVRGPAQAFDTKDGIVIHIPGAGTDAKLLLERDPCGGLKVWHSDGAAHLTDEELTELVLTALPDGGKRVKVGMGNARAYTSKIGVVAVIWKPVERPSSEAKP